MKKKSNIIVILMLVFVTMSSFVLKLNQNVGKVMVYGIVYSTQCNSEAYDFFSSELVDPNNYYQKQKDLETYLKKQYPNAKRIRMSSSKYDYGNSASNMCVIKWKGGTNKCSYDVASVHFGKTEAEALNNAIKHKNMWGGSNVSHSIVTEKYW